ncbi:MAG: peptidyl-prolyl cis-trans isomerase [Agathobacter sp.]|nr:peptidyl-prolyl cis-trans isomerase [Agathobacter sp.]
MRLKKLAALVLAGALCLTSFVGCGVNPNEAAATLGEQEVSAGLVNFVCKYQKATIDDTYVAYFGKDFWSQDLYGYGTTMEDDLKASIMDVMHDLYTLKAHMSDYKVELTEEEKAAITKAAQAFMAANSEEAIKELGATEEIVAEMLTLYTIQAKMYDAIIVDTDRNVTDEEANMRGITLVQIGIAGEYNDSGSYEKYTEDEVKALKETASKILIESKSVGLEKAATDNKYEAVDTAYNKKDTTMDETLLEALNALKVGETSTLIETTSAVYIARIDEDVDKEATEENREAIIAERENTLYSDKLTEWQKEDGWKVNESVLDKIDFHNLLTQKDPSEKNTEKVDSTEKADSTEKVDSTEGK